MLAGHKAELGIKHITKVTVITNDARPGFPEPKHKELHIFFHIEDVTADQIKDGESKDKHPVLKHDRDLEKKTGVLHVRKEGRNFLRVHTFTYKS